MAITLGDNEREAKWRDEVREFIKTQAPTALRSGSDDGEGSLFGRMGAIKEWREKVAEKGWIAPSWPAKYGGADMSVVDQFIMNEEFAESGVPGNVGGFGVMMIGPTIIFRHYRGDGMKLVGEYIARRHHLRLYRALVGAR